MVNHGLTLAASEDDRTRRPPPVDTGSRVSGADQVTAADGELLRLDAISKRFGGLHALSEVSLTVRRGQVTAVIGPNGAGKTTLFNIIAGHLRPTTGTVRFEGADVTSLRPDQRCRLGIARTFQAPRLFSHLTVLENVKAGRFVRTRATLFESVLGLPRSQRESAETANTARELLDSVDLWSQRDNYPTALPYGDRRRLEIARALATGPSVLLMDEPAAGMAAEEALRIMDLARRLLDRGLTVLLIEHNMQAVMSASDHVVVLNFGRTIAEGTPAEVQNNAEVLQAYLGVD